MAKYLMLQKCLEKIPSALFFEATEIKDRAKIQLCKHVRSFKWLHLHQPRPRNYLISSQKYCSKSL